MHNIDADLETGGDALRLHDLPGGEVRDADIADFPFMFEGRKRVKGLLQGRGVIETVQIEDIDHVHLQALARCLETAQDGLPGGPAFKGGLCRDDQAVAFGVRQRAQHRLGCAAVIDIGGVEMGDASGACCVEHGLTFACVGVPAKLHCAIGQG